MNSRGFFSAFVTAFAVIIVISFFYAQSVRIETSTRAAELGVLHQTLSKEWFLVRNALANFTSDAILLSIETNFSPSPASCVVPPAADFGSDVNAYWDSTLDYLNTRFGTNCDVNLSGDVFRSIERTTPNANAVVDRGRSYGLLSCTRSSGSASLTISRPFVIRKDIRTAIQGGSCLVSIYDILGDNPGGGVPFERLDVEKSYGP